MSTSTENSEQRATIGLLIFIATEIMFFAGLLSAYWVLRAQVVPWPPLDQPRLPVFVTGVNTLILFGSGLAITRARYRNTVTSERVLGWLLVAGFTGLIFLLVQGYEWTRLLHFGLTASSNIYGGFFYLIVGTHALHVVIALTIMGLVTYRAARGRYSTQSQTGLRLCQVYWIFVVLLWPFIYVALYLF